jgi:hypothetical protein
LQGAPNPSEVYWLTQSTTHPPQAYWPSWRAPAPVHPLHTSSSPTEPPSAPHLPDTLHSSTVSGSASTMDITPDKSQQPNGLTTPVLNFSENTSSFNEDSLEFNSDVVAATSPTGSPAASVSGCDDAPPSPSHKSMETSSYGMTVGERMSYLPHAKPVRATLRATRRFNVKIGDVTIACCNRSKTVTISTLSDNSVQCEYTMEYSILPAPSSHCMRDSILKR